MLNNTTQPTILVKKADGTSVRMTMDELQAYKKSQTASPAKPATTSVVQPVQSAEQNTQSKSRGMARDPDFTSGLIITNR